MTPRKQRSQRAASYEGVVVTRRYFPDLAPQAKAILLILKGPGEAPPQGQLVEDVTPREE